MKSARAVARGTMEIPKVSSEGGRVAYIHPRSVQVKMESPRPARGCRGRGQPPFGKGKGGTIKPSLQCRLPKGEYFKTAGDFPGIMAVTPEIGSAETAC
jgi:hypothetical protein